MRHRSRAPARLRLRVEVQGVVVALEIPTASVFVPNLIGLLNAATLSVRRGETVFEAGTGCGLHAILCAKLGAGRVVACDVSADAVRAARRNARLNGVADRCEFVTGSFEKVLARVGRRVGLVVTTLPNTPTGHRGHRERAMLRAPRVARYLDGGRGESCLNARLVRAAAPRLSQYGRIHLHFVAWGEAAPVARALRDAGLRCRTVARARVPRWGRRCNAAAAYERLCARGPLLLRWSDLPAAPDGAVRVVDAARRPRGRVMRPSVLVEAGNLVR
jgi:tRNA1(Val) A37 N6-methylase TrmN6